MQGNPVAALVLVDPMLDPLRAHPRFQAFVKELDFPT
jgi:hypothetical protein